MKKTVLCIIAIMAVFLSVSGQSRSGILVAKWDTSAGLYGFADTDGSLVIPARYESVVFNFYEGVAGVVLDDDYVLIDTGGRVISKAYTWMDSFDSHNLCLVNKGGQINESGDVTGGKYGYVDLNGNEVIPAKYDYIGGFNNANVAIVNVGGKTNKYGDFEGGKNGFVDVSGKVLVAPKYSFVGQFTEDGLAWTNVGGKLDDAGECSGGKFGYVDEFGNVVMAPKYDHVGFFTDDGHVWVNKGGKPYQSDKKTEKEINSRVKAASSANAKSSVSNYSVSSTGSAAINKMMEFNQKLAGGSLGISPVGVGNRQSTGTGSTGGMSQKELLEKRAEIENEILGTKWDVYGERIVGGKFGLVDRSGKEVVPVKYTRVADRFVDGCAWVAAKKYGYYNDYGRMITKLIYDGAEDFYNGVAIVTVTDKIRGDLKGLINSDGIEITKQEYGWIGPMESGFAFVRSFTGYDRKKKRAYPAKFGFVNSQGIKLTDMKYDGGYSISDGVALCRIGTDLGYVDSLGREITPFGLLEARSFQNGVALVKLSETDAASTEVGTTLTVTGHTVQNSGSGKYGLINRNGNAVTDFIYDAATSQHEGLIAVSINGQGAGWIDTKGDVVIPLQYQTAGNFIDGISLAKLNDKYGLIDRHNNVIVDFQYDAIYNHLTDYVVGAQIGSMWGAIDYSGNTVIPFAFNTSNEVAVISREVYEPNGLVPLTDSDVRRFKIRLQNLTQHFSIASTIPDSYWDF